MSLDTQPAQAGTRGEEPQALDDLPHDRYQVGVDSTGARHYHSARADRVVVVADGAAEQTVDLSAEDRRISGWIGYVGNERGWSELNYVETFGELLLEAF